VKTLEASEAAASFTKILRAVQSGRKSFEIVKQGVPCARLIPVTQPTGNSHELAENLAKARLSAEDRRAYAGALRKGRRVLKPLKNPWG
jgi:prevent-host-death family protein